MLTAIGCRRITMKYDCGKAACRKRVISRLLGVFSKQIDLLSSQYWCQLAWILVTFCGVNRSEASVKCARGLNPYQPVPPSSLFVGYTFCKYCPSSSTTPVFLKPVQFSSL